ncbi:MAG: hypothetical protein OEW12_02025 [Deltaproteobacteria bacterium]|nr:hypothetical protein [Deltaproteobacteria bacterium]
MAHILSNLWRMLFWLVLVMLGVSGLGQRDIRHVSLTGPRAVYAKEPSHLVRLYYSPAYKASAAFTPADPSGAYKGEKVDVATKGEFELILFRRLGLSATRQPFSRAYVDTQNRKVEEKGTQLSMGLTVYLLESGHDSFNLFGGYGKGVVENYEYAVAGARQDTPFMKNIPLERVFGGVEYTFTRLGIRLEAARITASKSEPGQTAKLDMLVQNLSFYIPFN